MSPEIAIQNAIRARLVGSPEVTDLVPSGSIIDRNQRPNPSPSIIIGEGQTVDELDSISRSLVRVYLDLHVWKKERSTEGVKTIAGAIRTAVHSARLEASEGFHVADAFVRSLRVLRDPDGETSHAVVTISAKVHEL